MGDRHSAAGHTGPQAIIDSLGVTLRALHRVPVPAGLLPPWLADAFAGKPWAAFHPPVVGAALQQVEAAVLVHGDLHGSNVIVDQGRVTGPIDFAEALAQPADVELDTILRWCAKARVYPPVPDERGLDETTLTEVPGWLHGAYPELLEREHLHERLLFYDMQGELALYAHHPLPDIREAAPDRIARLLSGHNHLDGVVW